jgi:hypothetical protein
VRGDTPLPPHGSEDVVMVYKSKDGWRWHRIAPNGKIVSESGEALRKHEYALLSAKRYNSDATVEED